MEMNNQDPVTMSDDLVKTDVDETNAKPPMGLEVILREFKHDKVALLSLFVIILLLTMDLDNVNDVCLF